MAVVVVAAITPVITEEEKVAIVLPRTESEKAKYEHGKWRSN